MNRNDILRRLAENAANAQVETLETRLQADPFSGWRLAVISDSFDQMSLKERKQTMLTGLEAEEFQWLDLITRDEAEISGGLPLDFELDDIPMWPEALARTVDASQPLVFASDLEDDLPSPVVVAFYSLRGGVGRSTALAYTAQLLARAGHTVLCVDMDLEAPGLAALFGKEAEVLSGKGVVALLQSFEMGDEPDVVDHVIRLSEYDELYCLPAGKPDADYARRLRLLDPESWYREEVNPLHKLMESIRGLALRPHVVLLDSRTGISPLSAPLLFDLEDLAVITFFPHPQARTGTGALVGALLKSHSRRQHGAVSLTPEPRFLVSPIPNSRAPEVMQRYHDRALDWISGWMAPAENGRRLVAGEPNADFQYIDPEEITAFVTYRESIATSDAVGLDPESATPYSLVAEWIESLIPVPGAAIVPTQHIAQDKTNILNTLRFSTGTAENQDRFSESFVETETFKKALALDKPLVIGRKGTGKTAVFRRLTEDAHRRAVAVLCPAAFRPRYPWTISADGFKALDDALKSVGAGWREFWNLYTCLCMSVALKEKMSGITLPGNVASEIQPLLAAEEVVELDIVERLKTLLRLNDVGLTAWEWLRSMDTACTDFVPLVFDGLDTGFGNHADDRARRTAAIEGLFSFMMDRESLLKYCRFKILLRDDISRKIRFDNRSHLYGRSIHLQWQNQSDYAKTVLKQALLSASFRELVKESVPRQEVENWSEEEVFRVWNTLVGERMKGSRTAFTRNWVWNRLADGNNDHGPRVLLQLFHEATAWERNENTKNPENRYIIRPKALSSSLDVTSREAVSAVQEEFTELDDLIQRLKQIGRSPIDAGDLEGVHEALDLAREVGLIQIYEGTEEDVKRYRVPDLYRIGLGLTRKGQL